MNINVDLKEPEVGDILEVKYKRKAYQFKVVSIVNRTLIVISKDEIPNSIQWNEKYESWFFPGPWEISKIDAIKIISKVKHPGNYLLQSADLIKKKIMADLSWVDLENFCKLRENRHLCEDDKFMESVYHEKIKKEFPPLSNLKNELLDLLYYNKDGSRDENLEKYYSGDELEFPTWKLIYHKAVDMRNVSPKGDIKTPHHLDVNASTKDPLRFIIYDIYHNNMYNYYGTHDIVANPSFLIMKYLMQKYPSKSLFLNLQEGINRLLYLTLFGHKELNYLEYLATLSLFPDQRTINVIKKSTTEPKFAEVSKYLQKYNL